jgi:hypothetical protein
MSVDEAAVAEAVHPELPQRTGGLEFRQGCLDRFARKPVTDVGGKPLDDLQIAADGSMDPEEVLEQRLAPVRLGS